MSERAYRVVMAKTEEGVIAAAQEQGFTVLKPIRKFSEMDTLRDSSLSNSIGRVKYYQTGYTALAFKIV